MTELGGSALGEDPGSRSSFPRELGKPVAQALHWRRPSPGASSPDGRHLDHLRHLRVPPLTNADQPNQQTTTTPQESEQ